jgi:hypothetical protein
MSAPAAGWEIVFGDILWTSESEDVADQEAESDE